MSAFPCENLLGEENRGFYGIMETFENERICIGGICAGESAKAIELTDELCAKPAGVRRPAMEPAGGAAQARDARQQGGGRPGSSPIMRRSWSRPASHASREVSMVKALSPEVLHEVVHGCLQLHGGTGFMRGTPIERMVRDARVLTIGGGATEVMLEEVAKRM